MGKPKPQRMMRHAIRSDGSACIVFIIEPSRIGGYASSHVLFTTQ